MGTERTYQPIETEGLVPVPPSGGSGVSDFLRMDAREAILSLFAPTRPDPCAGCDAERETGDCEECPVAVEQAARRSVA